MRIARLGLFGIPAFICTLAAASPNAPPKAPCQVAGDWVKSHLDALPQTIAAFNEFDAAHRKAIYSAASPQLKEKLWHQQFAYYAEKDHFSAPELAFVAESEALIARILNESPESGIVRGSKNDSLVRSLFKKGESLFGEQRANKYFGKLGTTAAKEATSSALAKLAGQDCNCDTWHANKNECSEASGNYCDQVVQTCDYHSWGCGPWDFYSCDGFCAFHL